MWWGYRIFYYACYQGEYSIPCNYFKQFYYKNLFIFLLPQDIWDESGEALGQGWLSSRMALGVLQERQLKLKVTSCKLFVAIAEFTHQTCFEIQR